MQKTVDAFMEEEGREVAEKILGFLTRANGAMATPVFFREAAAAFRECADGFEALAAKMEEGEGA